MFEAAENNLPQPVEKLDPYGDVALGVECAWPASLPASDVADADED